VACVLRKSGLIYHFVGSEGVWLLCDLSAFRMVKRKNLIDSDSGESGESASDLDSVSLYHFSC
jgi:uncharacterized protein YjhX (UPF0386 family)